MRNLQCCCIVLPVGFVAMIAMLGGYLLFFGFTVERQVEASQINSSAYVFGTVQDSVSVPLVGTAYLVSDGNDSVWVSTNSALPRVGRHVLVKGVLKSGLRIPGKLGGGALLKHVAESNRWDFPL